MPAGRPINTYTFRSRPDDPAPMRYALIDFLLPYLAVPHTTDALLAILAEWMPEDEQPTYFALFNTLKRDKRVRGINGPKAKWTTLSERELHDILADCPSDELLAAV